MDYPDFRCIESPTGAHHYICLSKYVWICKWCWQPVWQPFTIGEAIQYSEDKARHHDAYANALNHHPGAAKVLALLEEVRNLRKKLTHKRLYKSVAVVLSDYPEIAASLPYK